MVNLEFSGSRKLGPVHLKGSAPIEVMQTASIEVQGGQAVGSGYVILQFMGAVESDPMHIGPFPCDDRRQAEHAANLLINYVLWLMIDTGVRVARHCSRVRIGPEGAEVVFSLADGSQTIAHDVKVKVYGIDEWRQACSVAAQVMAESARETARQRESLTIAALREFVELQPSSPLIKAAIAHAWE